VPSLEVDLPLHRGGRLTVIAGIEQECVAWGWIRPAPGAGHPRTCTLLATVGRRLRKMYRQACPSLRRGVWEGRRVNSRLLLRVQELVDVVLERGERERSRQEFDGFDLRAVPLRIAEEEGWCARHADFLPRLQTGRDRVAVFAAVQAGLEALHVQPQDLGMLLQRRGLELLLIGEQAFVHRSTFGLLVGTPKGLRGFAGERVDGLQREIARHIFELPRRNVFFLKLWQRLTDVSATERSLVVGEFDQREGGLGGADGKGVRDTERGIDVADRRALLAARGQEFFHFLQLVENCLLACFEGVDILLQALKAELLGFIARWLGQTYMGSKEHERNQPSPC
jgi:hypothetical protein